MIKTRIIYRCKECGHESMKWLGQCPSCFAWASYEESESVEQRSSLKRMEARPQAAVLVSAKEVIGDLDNKDFALKRRSTGFKLLDKVLGAGLLDGSLMLLGGPPGVGKSTLASHIAVSFASRGESGIYISGEEEVSQLGARLKRIGMQNSGNFKLASSLTIEQIVAQAREKTPNIMIIDSVQTITSSTLPYSMGSPTLLRSVTFELLRIAKELKIIVLLLGHVTKQGMIAGPKHLEHMVDVVVEMSKPRLEEYRIVRAIKNRFGSSNGLCVFSMTSAGLSEVADPSATFISKEWRDRLTKENARIGLANSIALEGGQAFLVQVEALSGKKKMSLGKRACLGMDRNRVEMILAVLEKTFSVNLETTDIFTSLIGGIKVRDPGIDLSLAASLASSLKEKPLPTDAVFLGELSLSGDILAPKDLQTRVRQAKDLGFNKIFHPTSKINSIDDFLKEVL
ncbi:ATPase domain-containing protein [Elusimicrobiota bacterium]